MNQGMRTIIYPVKDLGHAKALYGKLLDTGPYVDEPYYAGFRMGDRRSVWIPMATATA